MREQIRDRLPYQLENAMVLDPRSVEAQSRLAAILAGRILDGMADPATEDLARAEGPVDQVLAASRLYPLAHNVKGQVLRAQRRWEEPIPEYETALASDHRSLYALAYLCWCELYAGCMREVTPLAKHAIRVSPRDPPIGMCHNLIGTAHLVQSQTDEAIVWLGKSRSATPSHPNIRARLACAYAIKGETDRASADLAEARKLSRDDRFTSIACLKAIGSFGVPEIRALHEAAHFAGLRKAGMPEE